MKSYFDLAEKEKVLVKRGKGRKYILLVPIDDPESRMVSDEWIERFMSIPMEHRCNPFDVSPSGDLFFADKRNLKHIDEAIRQVKNGETRVLSIEEQKQLFSI
jgi:hypothetical protein